MVRAALALTAALVAAPVSSQPMDAVIHGVTVSKPFFNPSLGQTIRVSFSVSRGGTLGVLILDRDGFVVRKLVEHQSVQAGALEYLWDGQDESGAVVPDEAYSVKIDLNSALGGSTYFPAAAPAEEFEISANYYDRVRAILSYTLPKAARLHVQAGCAVIDPKTKKPSGPVLKTIVNREPRPGGAVVDHWDGFDESGTIRVPDLPNFVIGIAGTSLPDNVILTSGNSARKFLDTVSARKGPSLLPLQQPGHHHSGLFALADTTPSLKLSLANADWSTNERRWNLGGTRTVLSATLSGLSAQAFAEQPGYVLVFIDGKLILRQKPTGAREVKVPLGGIASGDHVLAFNWASDYGPAAASSTRIHVESRRARGL